MTTKKHHPRFLQSMLYNFSYSLKILADISIKANISKNIPYNIPYQPLFQEMVLMILGLTALLSVYSKTATQYNKKKLKFKLKTLERNFDYKNIRDILTHWDEYSLGKENLQKKEKVPSRPPILICGAHNNFFRVYNYKVILLPFTIKYYQYIMKL